MRVKFFNIKVKKTTMRLIATTGRGNQLRVEFLLNENRILARQLPDAVLTVQQAATNAAINRILNRKKLRRI